MKAILFDSSERLHYEEVITPIAKSNELLVKIIASGFNPIDYQMRKNTAERKRVHSPILGREFSGIVVDVGKDVKHFKPGDAIFCSSGSMGSNGTYAEYITVPESIVVLKPTFLSFHQAAGLPSVGLTALQCLNRMKLEPTETILITGAAGGVGAIFIKMLLARGFTNFVATAGNEVSIDSLKKIGVEEHQILNYRSADFEKEALLKNNHRPFDFTVDLVGNQMAEFCGRVIKANGTYLDVTAFSTAASRELLFNKGAVLVNISNYVYSLTNHHSYFSKGLAEIVRLLEERLVTAPDVEVVGPLSVDTVEKAHKMLRENQTRGRKLVMEIANSTETEF